MIRKNIEIITSASFKYALQEQFRPALIRFGGIGRIQQQAANPHFGKRILSFDHRRDNLEHLTIMTAAIEPVIDITPTTKSVVRRDQVRIYIRLVPKLPMMHVELRLAEILSHLAQKLGKVVEFI